MRLTSRAEFDAALAVGDLRRVARGRYCLPTTDMTVRALGAVGGVLGRTSAAVHYGWAVKKVPVQAHIVVPRWRRVPPVLRRSFQIHPVRSVSVGPDGRATNVDATLLDCLRHLPLDEAVSVADSALRAGMPSSVLERIADAAAGPGAPQVRLVAARATGLAANPFESVLRVITWRVPGLHVTPQVVIREGGTRVRPDLVDVDLRIVLEADSFRWHGGRAALRRDARRYNWLTVNGWMVLRFAWEDVMTDPEGVERVLVAAVATAEVLNKGPRRRSVAA